MIRKLNYTDKEVYLQMAKSFYNSEAVLHPVPEKYFQKTFDELMSSNTYAECFVNEDDSSGKINSYALLAKTFSQEAGGLCVWIEEIYVLPEARGNGIGTKLFEHIFNVYKDSARFRLEVEPDNYSAIRLYERLGFECLGYSQMKKEML